MFNPDPGAATFPGTYRRPYPLPRLRQNTHPGWAPDVFTDFPPGVQPGAHGRGMATTVRDARQPKQPKQAAPSLLSLLTPAQMQTQAQTSVSSMVDPVIKQLTDAINARAAAAAGSVAGFTNSLAAEEAKAQAGTHQIYGDAQANQAKLDAALAAQLGGQGTALANSLATDLAASGQPGTGADQVRANTTGAVNAGSAMGGASLAQLLTEGASAENFSSLLPGFARAQGLAATHDLQGQALSDIADQTGQVTAQVPGLVRQIVGDLQSRNDQAVNENQRRVERGQDLTTHAAERGADLRYRAGRDTVGDAARAAEIRYRAGRDTVGDAARAAAVKRQAKLDQQAKIKSYMDAAGARTRESDYVWQSTNTGIRPMDGDPKKPGIQPVLSKTGITHSVIDTAPDPQQTKLHSDGTAYNKYGQQIDTDSNTPGVQPIQVAKPAVKPKKQDPKLGPNPAKSQSAKSNVMLDGYGRVYHDPKTGATRPFKPVATTAGGKTPAEQAKAAAEKQKAARVSAEGKANSLALGIIKAGAATVGRYKNETVTDPITLQPKQSRVRIGDKVARPYYKTLHQAEAAVYDGLKAAGYSDGEIIQFVQNRIDTYYDPGQAGRPRKGLTDKPDPTDRNAFPTTKPKPKPKKPAPRGLGTKPLG